MQKAQRINAQKFEGLKAKKEVKKSFSDRELGFRAENKLKKKHFDP